MTLLNLPQIFETFSSFFAGLKDNKDHVNSGLDSVLCLLQALYETCLGETVAYVPETVGHLVRIGALRALEPRLIERTYSTLSLVLRTISPTLLKSENEPKLRAAWEHVRPYLGPSNKAYVRKCIADAWAGVLRKARGDALQRLMSVLTEQNTPGMELVWTNAMKGTSHHVHSRALPIFTVLLEELAANHTPQAVATVRRVATALTHHCSSSNLTPLVEALLERVSHQPAASSSKNEATTLRFSTSTAMLEVMTAFLYTRKGRRFPAAQIKPAMLKLQSLIPEVAAATGEDASTWRRAVVSGVVGILNAGHLADWLSPGVSLIEALWNALSTPEAFAFANMCIAFKWAGVEQFLLAHISRAALTGIKADPLPTLVLLNNLAGAGFLKGGLSNVQGGRWRAALVNAIAECLETIRDSSLDTADLRLLGQVLKLIPHLASESQHFVPHLLAILDNVTTSKGKKARGPKDAEVAKDNYVEAGAWNNSHSVGRIIACLFQLSLRAPAATQDEIKSHFKKAEMLNTLLESWSWSREVLETTASFVEHWADDVE
jgi:U3 small nucleolar RNA-associated protein 20